MFDDFGCFVVLFVLLPVSDTYYIYNLIYTIDRAFADRREGVGADGGGGGGDMAGRARIDGEKAD